MYKKLCIITGFIIVSSLSLITKAINVGEVDLDFCNGSNKLHLQMDAKTSTGICMNIKNLSAASGTIVLQFVDGEMSQGETPVHACKTSADGVFGKNILLSGENRITLGGNQTIQKNATIDLPDGFAGDLFGCITYIVDENNGNKEGQMISIVSRKANTISINVKGDITSNIFMEDVGSGIGDNNLIHITKNADGIYTVSIKLTNKGSISEEIVGNISIDDGLLFSKVVPIINKTQVYPEETKEFKAELGKLPRYGGRYTFTLHLENTPINIDGTSLGKGTTNNITSNYAFSILKYGPLPVLGGGFVLLVILFFIERPFALKRKAKRLAKKAEKKAKKLADSLEKKHKKDHHHEKE